MSISLEVRTYSGGGRHAHGFAQILFPLRGSMRVDIEGIAGVVSGNRIAIIPQQHVHDYLPSSGCSLLVMDIDRKGLPEWQVPAAIRHQLPSILTVEPWLWRLFQLLGTEIGDDPRLAREAAHVAMTGLQLVRPAR